MDYQQMNFLDEAERRKSRSFREASLASLTALVENVWRLMTSAICGRNITESFAKLTQDGSWQKMSGGYYQVKMDGSLDEFCGTWPDGGGSVWWYCFPSAATGTVFEGDRVAIVATSNRVRWNGMDENFKIRPDDEYLEMLGKWKARQNDLLSHMVRPDALPECRHMRNDDGLSEQVDRFKCIGNSVIPQQFYPIFRAIAEIELGQYLPRMEGF